MKYLDGSRRKFYNFNLWNLNNYFNQPGKKPGKRKKYYLRK